MKKIWERMLIAAVALFLPIAVMLTSLEIAAFDRGFYAGQHEAYGISQVVGTEPEVLDRIMDRLLVYLRGDSDTLDMEEPIGGKMVEVFGDREKSHMVDVRNLFMGAFYLRNTLLAFSLLSLYLLYHLNGKKTEKPAKAVMASGFTVLLLSVLLAFMIRTDFQKYFIVFHEILFDNDLWILDPRTDVLIQMLPLGLFRALSLRIVKVFAVLHSALLAAGFVVWSRRKRIRN